MYGSRRRSPPLHDPPIGYDPKAATRAVRSERADGKSLSRAVFDARRDKALKVVDNIISGRFRQPQKARVQLAAADRILDRTDPRPSRVEGPDGDSIIPDGFFEGLIGRYRRREDDDG